MRKVVIACLILAGGCARSPGHLLVTAGPTDQAVPTRAATRPGPLTSTNMVAHPPSTQPFGGSAGGAPVSHAPVEDAPLDNGPVGSNAYWYLNRRTPELDVEIDATPGMAPSQQSIDLFRERVEAVADKPGGVRFLPVQTLAGEGRSTWTDRDVQTLERKYRSSHNTISRASIYLLFVNGQPSQQGPIGIAYSSSSDVIFEQAIRDAATPLVSAQSIEQATMVHEVGHLLSLVNLTYRSPRNHEDPNHRGHSNDPNSVMYWAIDNVGVANLLGGHTEPPTTFDADDLADLRDVRAGKLGPH